MKNSLFTHIPPPSRISRGGSTIFRPIERRRKRRGCSINESKAQLKEKNENRISSIRFFVPNFKNITYLGIILFVLGILGVPNLSFSATSLGPNLISNPSLESVGSNGLPVGWFKGGYGTNARVLTYPVQGHKDEVGAKIEITSYTSGDVKWYFSDVPVTSGKQYEFSNYSSGNVNSIIVVRYKMSDGSFEYDDLFSVGSSTTFQNTKFQFTIPSDVISITIFHSIHEVGSLIVDEYALQEVTGSLGDITNLIPNPDFEVVGANGLPASFAKGGWGSNTRVLTYSDLGVGGSRAVKTEVTSYFSGDAKWYFAPISVTPGAYTYSDEYISDVPSIVTVQFEHSNGTFSYQDIATLPAVTAFTHMSAGFVVRTNVVKITIFHLLKSAGSLVIDNLDLEERKTPENIFATGAVTLRFDDGWLSQYQNAIPKLNSVGLRGTFYITSQKIRDFGFTGYMSRSEITNIYNSGHEIAAHTRTHPHLTQFSTTSQQNEIQGSRQDLLSWNVGPILSFAYPFGDYNATSVQIVQDSGFTSAVASIGGHATQNSRVYELQRRSVEVNTTLTQLQNWVDQALLNKTWLILSIHQVDDGGGQYSITPANFNALVDYIISKRTPVVTTTEARKSFP